MTVPGLRTDLVTVPQRLLSLAPAWAAWPALARDPAAGQHCAGGFSGRGYRYGELAEVVARAAAGLIAVGLRPRDVVGLLLPDAASFVLAGLAIRAAGGVPTPVMPGHPVTEIAGQLADCGARMLFTAPPLTGAAQAAADQSWVRRVISFGDAAGAVTFDSLLAAAPGCPVPARPTDLALLPYHRQPGGALTPVAVSHQDLAARLASLAALTPVFPGELVLAAPPAGDGLTYTAALDHTLLAGAALAAVPAAEVGATAAARRAAVAIVASAGQAAGGGSRLKILVTGEPGPLGRGYGGS
jgi:acyl-CoA synthetase (AMP-forming)/AMP-acid ligase II